MEIVGDLAGFPGSPLHVSQQAGGVHDIHQKFGVFLQAVMAFQYRVYSVVGAPEMMYMGV